MKSKFSAKSLELIVAGLGVILTGVSLWMKMRSLEIFGIVLTIVAVIALVTRCEKHELFKLVGVSIVLATIITWIVPVGYFSGKDMIESGVSGVGISDFFLSGFYSVSYFLYTLLFVLVLGGFYGVLSKTGGYQTLLEKLAKFMKGKEVIFALVVSLLFATIASVISSVWAGLVFVPFIIALVLKMGLGKMSAFVLTFGSMLTGLVGTTFADNGVAYLNQALSMKYADVFWTRFGVFALAFVLYSFFTVTHIKKCVKSKSKEDAEDVFEVAPVKKSSKKAWPLAIVFVILLAIMVLGYVAWKDAFGLTVVLANLFKYAMWIAAGINAVVVIVAIILSIKHSKNAKKLWKVVALIAGFAAFAFLYRFVAEHNAELLSKILGSASTKALGEWDLSFMTTILIIASIIVGLIYRVGINEYLSSFAEGLKKMTKPALFIMLAYIIFIISYSSPFVPTMTNWLMELTNKFNPFLTGMSGAIASFFHPNFGYTAFSTGSYYISAYPDSANIVAVILPSVHGLLQFVVPTGALLLAGLSYTDISYKSWMKYIWKFFAGLFVCLIAVFVLITYM